MAIICSLLLMTRDVVNTSQHSLRGEVSISMGRRIKLKTTPESDSLPLYATQ